MVVQPGLCLTWSGKAAVLFFSLDRLNIIWMVAGDNFIANITVYSEAGVHVSLYEVLN